jgi:hypothetical protein
VDASIVVKMVINRLNAQNQKNLVVVVVQAAVVQVVEKDQVSSR